MEKQVGFAPVFQADSRLLILGSFPSVKSREVEFYYGNKQNRFWRTVCGFFGENVPENTQAKKQFLYRRKIALWDMAIECEIVGSADASMRNIKTVDLNEVLSVAKIERILLNGSLAYQLFMEKYGDMHIPYQKMPSTSPANPRFDKKVWEEALYDVFGILK